VFALCVSNVNDNAGVVVGVATEVVKSGLRLPELKLVTVPDPPPPDAVAETLEPEILHVTEAEFTKLGTGGTNVPLTFKDRPAPNALSKMMKFSATVSSIPKVANPKFGVN
jgi:hypothetical protein